MVIASAAWLLDEHRHRGEVMRNVEIAGEEVAGLRGDALVAAVRAAAGRYGDAKITIRTPKGDLALTPADIGLTVDVDATVERALDAGHHDVTPLPWLTALIGDRESGVVAKVDRSKIRAVIAAKDPTGRKPPVEPGINGEDGQIAVVLGQDGIGLDEAKVAEAIEAAATRGELPIAVNVEAATLHPRFSRSDAAKLADDARALTSLSIDVRAGDAEAEIPGSVIRSWVTSRPGDDALTVALDPDEAVAGLAARLDSGGSKPEDARFTIYAGKPVILAGVEGKECCDQRAVTLILAALEARVRDPIRLPLRTVEPDQTTEDLEKFGVAEEVASFTTRHMCCENRVSNIHRIADLVRGVVIQPGETFSVNEHVGERTTENGFVIDHVIENGSFAEAVGGGVSQFATTFFNAAFFAGLDLKEYQSHSIYISRYPYGREATLSYPKPDLVIGNSTPYGVLVWPTYTGSSLTVTLYSTKFVHGEQTAQTQAPIGPNGCTRVATERTRTYVDGTSKKDRVFAVYRPSEGVQCG